MSVQQKYCVDRRARNRVASDLRRLISGKITSDDFENDQPISEDPAIEAVYSTAWCLYSDGAPELKGAHAMRPAETREALRWILFLDGNCPYLWPKRGSPGWANQSEIHKRIFLFGGRGRAKRFFAAGDFAAWPFISRADFKHALRHPKRLSGNPKARVTNVST